MGWSLASKVSSLAFQKLSDDGDKGYLISSAFHSRNKGDGAFVFYLIFPVVSFPFSAKFYCVCYGVAYV